MKSINLIPQPRRDARRRRTHLRRCAAACAAYTVVLGAACAVTWGAYHEQDPSLQNRLDELDDRIKRTGDKINTANAELAAARAELFAARTVAEQPDWSLLLKLLAGKTGDEVVLRGLKLRPSSATDNAPATLADARARANAAPAQRPAPAAVPRAGAPPVEPGFLLDLNGLARSPLAVSQFVLRLEQAGLFGRVTLRDTGRELFLAGEAIAFRIECALDEADLNAPPRPADGAKPAAPRRVAPPANADGATATTAMGGDR